MLLSASAFAKFSPERVAELITETAEIEILPRFRSLETDDIQIKADQSLVTIADQEAEKRLTRALMDLLPGSTVVGEESFCGNPKSLHGLHTQGAVWIIDPIDGTKAFVAGKETFATMVSLCMDGTLAAAWIHVPVLHIMVQAIVHEGATLNGQTIRIPTAPFDIADLHGGYNLRWLPTDLQHKTLCAMGPYAGMKPDSHSGWEAIRLLTDENRVLLNTHVTPWDTGAPVLVYREAGGIAAYVDGSTYHPADFAGAMLYAPTPMAWLQARDTLFPGPRGPACAQFTPDGKPIPAPPSP